MSFRKGTTMAETNASGGNSATETTAQDSGSRGFLQQAQQSVGSAANATMQAVKDHPVAAAAIAAGTAAAVGGAAYAATQMRSGRSGSASSK